MSIAPIRTEAEYHKRLDLLEKAMLKSRPNPDEIAVQSILVEKWEEQRYVIAAPSAIEAIKFRMARGGLKPRDLEPYIGSRSRVSEVLSGARPLSIEMIRALNMHLGIPAAPLIKAPAPKRDRLPAPSKLALAKLQSFGLMKARESFAAFIGRGLGTEGFAALLRKTRTSRTNAKTDLSALHGWCAAVQIMAADQALAKSPTKAKKPIVKQARTLAKLSAHADGPERVRAALAGMGVAFVVLDHLPGTYLDGAAMCRIADGAPIIAITRRHDRLDNFWFTLLHEYMHVVLHLNPDRPVILDDLEVRGDEDFEAEADSHAQEALIPPAIWKRGDSDDFDLEDVADMAREAEVHPAIVAGRWQREHNDYRRFAKIVGRGEVRGRDL